MFVFIRAGNRGRWPASVKLVTLPLPNWLYQTVKHNNIQYQENANQPDTVYTLICRQRCTFDGHNANASDVYSADSDNIYVHHNGDKCFSIDN